jgi:hypothetical protein
MKSTSGCRSRSPRPKPERLASRGSAGGRPQVSARRSRRIIVGRRRSRGTPPAFSRRPPPVRPGAGVEHYAADDRNTRADEKEPAPVARRVLRRVLLPAARYCLSLPGGLIHGRARPISAGRGRGRRRTASPPALVAPPTPYALRINLSSERNFHGARPSWRSLRNKLAGAH